MAENNLEFVPAELRERTQWVHWKVEKRGGLPTKVPVLTRHAWSRAKSNDPKTWSRFKTAVEKLTSYVEGVGYVFAKQQD